MAQKINAAAERYIFVLFILMFLSFALLPIGYILSDFMGYELELTNVSAAAVILTVIPVFLTALYKVSERAAMRKTVSVLLGLSLPLSLTDGLQLSIMSGSVFVIVCSAISLGCLLFLNSRRSNITFIKNAGIALSVLVITGALAIIYLKSLLGGFLNKTVVQTTLSPDGSRYSEVIVCDEGALGGATLVNVYYYPHHVLGFLKFKRTERLYSGRWSDQFDLKVYWKDNRHLIINSKEYYV